jgi:hypothetical protein
MNRRRFLFVLPAALLLAAKGHLPKAPNKHKATVIYTDFTARVIEGRICIDPRAVCRVLI